MVVQVDDRHRSVTRIPLLNVPRGKRIGRPEQGWKARVGLLDVLGVCLVPQHIDVVLEIGVQPKRIRKRWQMLQCPFDGALGCQPEQLVGVLDAAVLFKQQGVRLVTQGGVGVIFHWSIDPENGALPNSYRVSTR